MDKQLLDLENPQEQSKEALRPVPEQIEADLGALARLRDGNFKPKNDKKKIKWEVNEIERKRENADKLRKEHSKYQQLRNMNRGKTNGSPGMGTSQHATQGE